MHPNERMASNTSVESMSLCSSEEHGSVDKDVFVQNIVTNTSFLEVGYHALLNEEITPTPSSNSEEFESPLAIVNCQPIGHSVGSMLQSLGINTSDPRYSRREWFQRFCTQLTKILSNIPERKMADFQKRLKKHTVLQHNGDLSLSLVAASLLKIHPDVEEYRSYKEFPHLLPSTLQERLSIGGRVSIRCIIYGEALMDGYLNPAMSATQSVTAPPADFVDKIRRPDVLRAASTHSIITSYRFPKLAAAMHRISRDLWSLMYEEMMDVQIVMDIYDEYFSEFNRQLSLIKAMPVEGLPIEIIRSVLAKYNDKYLNERNDIEF
ncbi:uncharacterized protein [Palaemon carinicauda]|uniref:uncharacterized protein n=1 Tax=Palaemon carinicauda TaxID=392227 RepID=UPI0035B6165E